MPTLSSDCLSNVLWEDAKKGCRSDPVAQEEHDVLGARRILVLDRDQAARDAAAKREQDYCFEARRKLVAKIAKWAS